MKRPSFQFYPGDWLLDQRLRKCSPAARGVWVDVLCALHNSDDGYGFARCTLAELANLALGADRKLLKELVEKGVLRGSDKGLEEPLIYRPRTARQLGDPVVLLEACHGPLWYSKRLVKDEHRRKQSGGSTRFGGPEDDDEDDGDDHTTHRPPPSPSRAPSRRHGEGSSAAPRPAPNARQGAPQGEQSSVGALSSSSSSSSASAKDSNPLPSDEGRPPLAKTLMPLPSSADPKAGKTPGLPPPMDPKTAAAATLGSSVEPGSGDGKRPLDPPSKPRKAATPPPPAVERPEDVSEATWRDWHALRRAKKAPITATVLTAARVEAGKARMTFDAFLAEWCSRGSQGLKAEWLTPAPPPRVNGHANGFHDPGRMAAMASNTAAAGLQLFGREPALEGFTRELPSAMLALPRQGDDDA